MKNIQDRVNNSMKKLLMTIGLSLAFTFGVYAQNVKHNNNTHIVAPHNQGTIHQTGGYHSGFHNGFHNGYYNGYHHNQWYGSGRFHHGFHNRFFYTSHYSRIILIGGCYYFYDGGCWFPAYGYDINCVYPFDGPINCN